jgi:hypothetical protein
VSADKTGDAIKLNLRLPKPLHRRLKQQAKRNNVSLNTEIVNQLEGAETSTAKRMAEIMKPLFDQAIEEAIAKATGRTQHPEIMFDVFRLELERQGGPVHTEAELEKRLDPLGLPAPMVEQLLQVFRERQATGRRSFWDKPEKK